MGRFAGVDGCPGGWLCIVSDPDANYLSAAVFRSAEELLAHDPTIQILTIDMPIGLVNVGRRRCDELAREMLGNRHVCVSNAPIRPALYAPSRLAASGITEKITNRKVGSNEWALYPKIINLDRVITRCISVGVSRFIPRSVFVHGITALQSSLKRIRIREGLRVNR